MWLSNKVEQRTALTWIAAISKQVDASIAATSGVATPEDAIKYILAGADVVMSTSALVRNGADYATEIIDGLSSYLERKQLDLEQARGLLAVPDDASAAEYERNGYVSALEKAKTTYGSLR